MEYGYAIRTAPGALWNRLRARSEMQKPDRQTGNRDRASRAQAAEEMLAHNAFHDGLPTCPIALCSSTGCSKR